MKERKKKILSYVGLAFMAVFTVSLILFFFNPDMLNGVIAFIALFSGVGGICVYLFLRQYIKPADTSYLPDPDAGPGEAPDPGDAEADGNGVQEEEKGE